MVVFVTKETVEVSAPAIVPLLREICYLIFYILPPVNAASLFAYEEETGLGQTIG